MRDDRLIRRYRAMSRQALGISVLIFAAVSAALLLNARRLNQVETEISQQRLELERLTRERGRLDSTLRSLQDAPEGGLRALVKRVNTTDIMHDFFLWIDAGSLEQRVTVVRYEFEDPGYEAHTSTNPETGFGIFFRGPLRPGQALCPGNARASIGFADGTEATVSLEICSLIDADA